MDNNINSSELEQMRGQMQMLLEKLDRQEITNERLLRESVSSKMSWIKRFVYFEFCLIPILALLWYLMIKDGVGVSWYNYWFMIVIVIIDVIYDYRINVSSLRVQEAGHNCLRDTMNCLIEMKRNRAKQLCISIPAVLIWFIWVGMEIMHHSGSGVIFILLGVGFFLGIGIGVVLYRKMQDTNNSLIEQLKAYSVEE